MADNRITRLNGVTWPDGTITPSPGMYIGVQSVDSLQFYELPIITLFGDATGTGQGPGVNNIEVTLANTGVLAGSYINSSLTVDSAGRITSIANGVVSPGVTEVNIIGENGITSIGGPITTTGTITLSLGDISTTSVSTTSVSTTSILTSSISIANSLQFFASKAIIVGNFDNEQSEERTSFVTETADSQTVVPARPNGASSIAGWEVENNSSGLNCAGSVLFIGPTMSGIQNYVRGTGTSIPFYITTGAVDEFGPGSSSFMQDVIGNVSIGGDDALTPISVSGFLYINSMEGMPTSVPTVPMGSTGPQTGKTPITADTSNNKMYFFTGGEWHNTNTPDYEEFIATAGQTVFNTTIPTFPKVGKKSYLLVFVDGNFQQEGVTKKYTVTGETQITFNIGITEGTDIVIYSFG